MRVLGLDEEQRQWFEDRCAMREIHFGLARREAEIAAWTDLRRVHRTVSESARLR